MNVEKLGWRIPNMITSMIDDKRRIALIFKDSAIYGVGENGITKIEVYQEPGQMAMINYAAVFRGESLWMRVDMSGWGVAYYE